MVEGGEGEKKKFVCPVCGSPSLDVTLSASVLEKAWLSYVLKGEELLSSNLLGEKREDLASLLFSGYEPDDVETTCILLEEATVRVHCTKCGYTNSTPLREGETVGDALRRLLNKPENT